MPMKRPCPKCGTVRLIGGKSQHRLCVRCYRESQAAPTHTYKPLPGQQFKMLPAAERAALLPTSSWWAVPASDFAVNYAKELPRLMAIGPDLEKEQKRPTA